MEASLVIQIVSLVLSIMTLAAMIGFGVANLIIKITKNNTPGSGGETNSGRTIDK